MPPELRLFCNRYKHLHYLSLMRMFDVCVGFFQLDQEPRCRTPHLCIMYITRNDMRVSGHWFTDVTLDTWYIFLPHIESILPKGSYPPCVSMAGRALLAGYHRYRSAVHDRSSTKNHLYMTGSLSQAAKSYAHRQSNHTALVFYANVKTLAWRPLHRVFIKAKERYNLQFSF